MSSFKKIQYRQEQANHFIFSHQPKIWFRRTVAFNQRKTLVNIRSVFYLGGLCMVETIAAKFNIF